MTDPLARLEALRDELRRRVRRAEFLPEKLCEGNQLAYVLDPSDFIVACTTRRAGKTVGNRVRLLRTALATPGVTCLYIATTRGVAEELMWRGLKEWNTEYGLGGETNDTKLLMTFPNGSRIRLGGAETKKEADKLRGAEKIALAIIDEAQNFRADILEYVLTDILEPSMLDVGGTLVVSGTPGPVPAGFFYDCTQNKAFSQHFWTLQENKHLGVSPDEYLAKIRARRKITEDDPTYQREYKGRWVKDENVLVFKYDAKRHACAWQEKPLPGWRYVLSFDIGFNDADAVGVLGWGPRSKVVQLVHEKVQARQTITQLGNQLAVTRAIWRPQATVGDLGALGKKIGAELVTRWKLPLEAADKTRKAEHIALVNDALREGTFQAPADSEFARDSQLLQWDADALAKQEYKISEAFHSDACDMTLYGFRKCRAFLEKEETSPPTEDEKLAEMKARRAKQVRRQTQRDWTEAMEDEGF